MELVIRTNHLESESPQPDILDKLDAWMHQIEKIHIYYDIHRASFVSCLSRRPGAEKLH